MDIDEDEQVLPIKVPPSLAVPSASPDGAHLDTLQVFIDDFNVAVERSLARDGSPYERVNVLFLRWEDDVFLEPGVNNGVQGEIDGLEDVLRTCYGYSTETYLIPSTNSQRSLQKKVFQLQDEHDSRSDLLLVYYGGHGSLNEFNQSIWAQGNGPSVDWHSIQHLLENAAADVAIFLDCCYAASADKRSVDGTIEILAACCREAETIGISNWSFTNRLTEVLKGSADRPLTIALLHAKLVNYRGVEGLKKLTKTPVHSIMSDSIRASIRLSPTIQVSTPHLSLSSSDLSQDGLSSTSSSLSESNMSPSRVLIAISLKDNTQNIGDWLQWLTTHMPTDIENLKLIRPEALWGSHSTLSLISMPVAVWDMFSHKSAYQCFGFVTTPNLLPNDLHSAVKTEAGKREWAGLVPQPNHSSLPVLKRDDVVIAVLGKPERGVEHFIAQACGERVGDEMDLSSKSKAPSIATLWHHGKTVHLVKGAYKAPRRDVDRTDLGATLDWLNFIYSLGQVKPQVHGIIIIQQGQSRLDYIDLREYLSLSGENRVTKGTPITVLSDLDNKSEVIARAVDFDVDVEHVAFAPYDGTQRSALSAVALNIGVQDQIALEGMFYRSAPRSTPIPNRDPTLQRTAPEWNKTATYTKTMAALQVVTASACTIM